MTIALRQIEQIISSSGKPVLNGYIYIGSYGQDPVANPLNLFSDVGLTIPIANPQRTDSLGRPVNDIYIAEQNYSYQLKDQNLASIEGPKDRIAVGGLQFVNLAALRGIIGGYDHQDANLLGYYSAGDGGGGQFYWSASSVATDNGGTVIKPTAVSGAGRWLKEVSARLTILEFGASPTQSAATNSAAINAALAAQRIIRIPAASAPYSFDSTLLYQVGTKLPAGLVGDGWGTCELQYTGTGTAIGPVTPGSLFCPVLTDIKLSKSGAAGASIGINQNLSEFGSVLRAWIKGFFIGQQMGVGATSDAYFNKTEHCLFENNTTHTKVGNGAAVNANVWRDNKRTGGTTGVQQLGGDGNRYLEETAESMTYAYLITGNDNRIAPAYIDATVTNGVTIVGGLYNEVWHPSNAGGTANPITDGGTGTLIDRQRAGLGLQLYGAQFGNAALNQANVLDYFRYTTFTPTLLFGGASTGMTYGTQTGRYTRVGNRVFFEVSITLTAKGSSTGAAQIGGLPFSFNGSSVSGLYVYYYDSLATITGAIGGRANTGDGNFNLAQGGAASHANMSEANFTNTSTLRAFGQFDV